MSFGPQWGTCGGADLEAFEGGGVLDRRGTAGLGAVPRVRARGAFEYDALGVRFLVKR